MSDAVILVFCRILEYANIEIMENRPKVGIGVKEVEYMKLVFLAISKHHFYFRMHISKFVLEQDCVPLNPFMIFEYFLLDAVERDKIRNANNNLVKQSDELWAFGPISDGVLAEIKLAKSVDKPIKYFEIVESREIKEIPREKVKFEEGLERFSAEL